MRSDHRIIACIFIYVAGLTFSTFTYALKNWDKLNSNETTVYTPQQLQSNETFKVTIFSPQSIEHDSMTSWFKKQVPALQKK